MCHRHVLNLALTLVFACAADPQPLTPVDIRADLSARWEMPRELSDEELNCLVDGWRQDAILPVLNCEEETRRDESRSDDECFYAATHGLAPTEGASAFAAACEGRAAECGADFSFDADSCSRTSELLTDSSIARLETCLEGPCTDFGPCWANVAYCE